MAAMVASSATPAASRALGRYELIRPLARGGMADVYLARRRAAGIEKQLVVKRMRPETVTNPRLLDLFVREARLSMSLVHQNIVPVFDFGRIDDEVFLAMERVEGRDLGQSLARAAGHRLPPVLAAFVAAECCQALDYAHQRKDAGGVALGIVHRDVTPRNVLLSWSGEVKLTDFGIAALAGDATTRLLGTPEYMAPEQASRQPIDPRTDVYGIGVVLREAVSGACPRVGADRAAILEAARRGELLPWSHPETAVPESCGATFAIGSGEITLPGLVAEPIPPALVAIIDRATATRPCDRYPDARAMFDDLDSFIVDQRSACKGDPPPRQLAAWLASVWEGDRDDSEAAALCGADIDDAACESIGINTIRSLAETADADDDSQVGVVVGCRAAASSAIAAPLAASSPAYAARTSLPGVPRLPALAVSPVPRTLVAVTPPSPSTVTPETSATSARPAGRSRRRRSRWTRGARADYLPLVASILLAALAVGSLIFEVTIGGVRQPPVLATSAVLEHSAGQRSVAGHPAADAAFAGSSNSDMASPSGIEHARQPTCGLRINPISGFIARRTRVALEGKHRPRISSPRVVTGAASSVPRACDHGPDAPSARAALD
jgi:serine/threonine protein kinase